MDENSLVLSEFFYYLLPLLPSTQKLEAMTCVCSVGLDMIAIPGDTSAETIAAIIADEDKPICTILFPIYSSATKIHSSNNAFPMRQVSAMSFSAETIAAIIADEAAIGMINKKTTAVRVIPVHGKNVGDKVVFGGLLGYAPIMELTWCISRHTFHIVIFNFTLCILSDINLPSYLPWLPASNWTSLRL